MPEKQWMDDLLLKAWIQGDRAAGDKLFARHYPSVARFFHNKISAEAREDLIQDTFLACWRSATHLRGPVNFRAYLLGIARHVLMDHLRQLGRRKARMISALDLEEMPVVSFDLSPVAIVVQQEEQRLLLEALRRIPLDHQIALKMHCWEQRTAAEISEVLGIPLGTAKTRLHAGRAHLKDQLRKTARSSEALAKHAGRLDR